MGLQRRRAHQLAEAEDKAAAEMAAERASDRTAATADGSTRRGVQQQRQIKPHSALRAYLTTVVMACGFWIAMQLLARWAAHLSPHAPAGQ